MTVEVRCGHQGGAALAGRLRLLAQAHLRALEWPEAGLSVFLTSDRFIRSLNRRWRGVDRATDVLSFPLGEALGSEGVLGDVVISIDTARRRARGEGRPLLAEVNRYLVHGILHLLGHDHEEPRQARSMAALEARVLGEAGMLAEELTRQRRRRPAVRRTAAGR